MSAATARRDLKPRECTEGACDCRQHRWNGAPCMLRTDPPSTCICGHPTSRHRFRYTDEGLGRSTDDVRPDHTTTTEENEMSGMNLKNVKSVWVDEHRWSIYIHVTLDDGTEKTWVASADSGVTWGDGIWFGTEDEYDAEVAS